MQRLLLQGLQDFTDPNSEAQLRDLEELLSSVEPAACGKPEFEALLQVFERFPKSDGYGVFWSILHLLEACSGYEEALVHSVQRKPVEFNLTMVNRLANAGVINVNGQSLAALLASAADSKQAGKRAKQVANRFIERLAARGGADA
jgi:hypothetical protein